MREDRRRKAPAAPVEEIEGQLEGRNALQEAVKLTGDSSVWPPRPRTRGPWWFPLTAGSWTL